MKEMRVLERFWYRIADRVSTLYYNIKIGIINLIVWAPLIWKNQDWDEIYVFKLLAFKFKRMRKAYDFNYFAEDRTPKELEKAEKMCYTIIKRDDDTFEIGSLKWEEERRYTQTLINELMDFIAEHIACWWS